MTEPTVDVVIPVHAASRPIHRAVTSVLEGTAEPTRVTVVCHNVERDEIAGVMHELAEDPRVRLLALRDGIPSPAGPINLGLDAATAPFTALLDSDDTWERGAIDSWMARQRRDGADVVIPMLRDAAGRSVHSPPVRPFRSRALSGLHDRLAYRTRQHGLVARARFPDVRMTPGLPSGEDVVQGLRIWFSGARISLDRGGPGYLIHVDHADRTSTASRTAAEDFAFLPAVIAADWVATLTAAERTAIAVKLLRTHLMDALGSRFGGDASPASAEREALADATRRIVDFAPASVRVLSRRDRRIVDAVLGGSADAAALHRDLAVRNDYRRPGNVLSASAGLLLHREAPLRFLAAVAVTP